MYIYIYIYILFLFCLYVYYVYRFAEKRIGYLGLTLLLDGSSEVAMLTTNSLKQDLQHTNQYINSLALGALTNGSPIEVVRSLIPEVEGLLRCSNPFIRKKAALAAAASVRRIGAEAAAALLPTLPLLCNDKSHGVLLGACALIFAMYDTQQQHVLQQQQLQQLLPPLVKALRACSSPTHQQTAEYDIAGIVDPLLQARLLRAIALLAQVYKTAAYAAALAYVAAALAAYAAAAAYVAAAAAYVAVFVPDAYVAAYVGAAADAYAASFAAAASPAAAAA